MSSKNYIILFLFLTVTVFGQSSKSLYDVALIKAKAGKLPQAILDITSFISLNPNHIPSRELGADINNQL